MVEICLVVLVVLLLAQSRKLSGRITSLERDMATISRRLGETAAPPVSADAEQERLELVAMLERGSKTGETEAAPALAASDAPEAASAEHLEPSPSAPNPDPAPSEEKSAGGRPTRSFESTVGARWPVWVGGVALAFGGVFLVRYSIEAGLLGPAARLTLAAAFGLVLMAAGELVRRRAMPRIAELYANAMIPGALTAAGVVTLLGAIYAAHAVYGFIGPALAFTLLCAVSLATIGLSLLHGQALAGLGLLAALLVPVMIDSRAPDATALFLFLSITWLAVAGASRIRRWTVVPMLATIGTGLWSLAALIGATSADLLPPAAATLVTIAGTMFIWPGFDGVKNTPGGSWRELLSRPPLKITLSLGVTTALFALAMVTLASDSGLDPLFAFTAVIAALAALGGSRRYGLWAALLAAAAAVCAILLLAFAGLGSVVSGFDSAEIAVTAIAQGHEVVNFLLLGALFTLIGSAFLRRFHQTEPRFCAVWAVLMGVMPALLGFVSLLNFGSLTRDWTHGLYGLAIGLVLLAGAERQFRLGRPAGSPGATPGAAIDWPANILVAGGFAGLALTLHALTSGIMTTILLSVLGFAFVAGLRLRPWPALPWMMAAAIVVIFGRIAWQPTLVGPNSLGTTPFLNALLPGYGIPTLLAITAAWRLRASPDARVRNVLQALAALAALMTVAVLVRHAMNGGVLDSRAPTLGEQSVYTLITIGFSGILMTLDLKAPSPVFRWGSMLAGAIATLNVLSLHVFALNPFFSGEDTGAWPVVNLLLIGYLLPALAYAATALLARGRRPQPYVAMLSVAGSVLGFLWATLSVRRFWQGSNIADWKRFVPAETYTYSVVWLLIGVGLLALGSRFNARSLRLASAALVLIAVAKVFLIDMSNLEGILRALSFIGLGAVLIGIGLFYQRILVNKDGASVSTDSAPTPPKDTA